MIDVRIFTSEGPIFAHQATSALIHTSKGDIEVMTGHAPLLQCLGDGSILLSREGHHDVRLTIGQGFCLITPKDIQIFTSHAKAVDIAPTLQEEVASLHS